MPINKQDLIGSILAVDERQDKAILESLSIAQLTSMLEKSVIAFQETQAERLLEAQADIAVTRVAFQLRQRQADEPRRQAEAAELERRNKRVFLEAAKEFGFATIDANYSLLVQELPVLSVFDIRQFIARYPTGSGLGLVPPTESELQQWTQEAIAAHNKMLLAADPVTLKKINAQEAEDRRALAQQEYVRQQDQAGREREAAAGKPLLPQVNNLGEKLDAAFFNKLEVTNREEYRRYVKTFGANQVVDRIRGIR